MTYITCSDVDVVSRFPLNQTDLGLYIARNAAMAISLLRSQGDIKRI